jgi:hypothetical protein
MLVTLAERAASCAPASCGAATTLSAPSHDDLVDPEPSTAVTHPDLAPLVAVQWTSGEGPIPAALRSGEQAGADDLLADRRWPGYRTAALDAGVRSCATLPFRRDGFAVTVTLCGFRPGAPLDDAARTATTLIGDLAVHTLVHDRRYEQALTEVDQLDIALRNRPVVDQASGILMHILGCGAETAFDVLRRQSQRTNRKLTDLAHDVVSTRGQGIERELARLN